MRILKIAILTVLSLVQITITFAQTRSQLEAKRKKTQEDIAYTKQILAKTSKKKSAALHNLNALNQIISQREQVIDVLTSEIDKADNEINIKKNRLKEYS